MTDSELADRLAITDLINRYCDAITRNDWDQHEGCFAPDATWELGAPFDHRVTGAAAIRAFTEPALTTHDWFVQKICSLVIDIESPESASARVVIEEIGRAANGERHMLQYGLYRDRMVKLAGRWVFASRHFDFIYAETPVLAGDAITPRSELSKR